MLHSGQFDNLQWNKLEGKHATNWKLLQTRYGLPPQEIVSSSSLSELAVKSIQACRTYLFTDGAKCRTGWRIGKSAGILPIKDLEECLTPALCDHLIVTFAYRFLCDNLTPTSLPKCLNVIYNCRVESTHIEYKTNKKFQIVKDKDKTRATKSNFTKPKKRSCEAYNEKIRKVYSLYERQLEAMCGAVSADYFAGIRKRKWLVTDRRMRIARHKWKSTSSRKRKVIERRKQRLNDHAFLMVPQMVDRTPEVKSDLLLIEKEYASRTNEQYAAPNWLYTVAMACTWTNSPLAAKLSAAIGDKTERLVFERDYYENANLLHHLTRFLGDSEWGPLLFGTAAPGSKRFVYRSFEPVEQTKEMQDEMERWQSQVSPSLMELRSGVGNQAFASVPYIQDQIYQHLLPPQSYVVIGRDNRYEIPCEVQQMFNSYLVERTFHGYASVLAMECIKRRQAYGSFELHRDQYQALPAAVRLRAPLLHPAWIQLTDFAIGETGPSETAIPWIEDHVDYWNRLSLPILEEHFIQSIWSCYKADGIDAILAQITTALTQEDGRGRRCDRLNRYRLIPTEGEVRPPKADHVFNEVMKNAYLAGLGCKPGQTDGRWIDPGRAIAFD